MASWHRVDAIDVAAKASARLAREPRQFRDGVRSTQVEDLLVASPATVSRVGIIYMEPKALGLDVLRESWVTRTLAKCPCFVDTQFVAIMALCFDRYLFTAINFMRAQMSELLPTQDNNSVSYTHLTLPTTPYV